MNVPWIENIVQHRLELLHMKTSPVNVQKDSQSFQFILSMVSIVGILFRDHTHRNCSLNSYVRKVLLCCIPYLGPRSILVMDNAIHHFEVLELLCISWQPGIGALTPKLTSNTSSYSPYYNLVEEIFVGLKANMKNYILAAGYKAFNSFLEAGFQYVDRTSGDHFR